MSRREVEDYFDTFASGCPGSPSASSASGKNGGKNAELALGDPGRIETWNLER